jgi:hypothetical protein
MTPRFDWSQLPFGSDTTKCAFIRGGGTCIDATGPGRDETRGLCSSSLIRPLQTRSDMLLAWGLV